MKVGKTEIKVEQGDITETEAQAIVNAANNQFWMGGGVAGAIKRKGGAEIEKEAVDKGPIEVGEAVATKAGKLKAEYVIHAATMGMDFKTDAEKIKEATLSSLRVADELEVKSIAFPALGTGVGGFPATQAAEIMLTNTKKYLKSRESFLEQVIFILFDQETFNQFRQVLQSQASQSD